MGQPVNHRDVFLEKLPAETRKIWELSTPGTEPQTYDDLKKYPNARCHALEAATLSTPPTSTPTKPRFTSRQNSEPSQSSQRRYNVNVATSKVKCKCCNGTHKLHLRPKFKDLTVPNRAVFVKFKKTLLQLLESKSSTSRLQVTNLPSMQCDLLYTSSCAILSTN